MKTKRLPMRRAGLTVLGPKDPFQFACHKGLSCFTMCCRDTAIFLTPYDIIQLKKALDLSSETFLQQYTICLSNDNGFPVLLLRLSNDTVKRCPFVTSDGCTVYPYRPWSCRVYPLQPEGNAIANSSGKEYYSATKTTFCLGFLENQVSTVKQWTEHQGIPIYREMETYFQKITLNKSLSGKKIQNKKIREMIYMACYDLDRFRRFVFESTFLKRFEMDPAEVKQLKSDDVALYKFAMRWLEYGLIKQATLNVKPDILSTEKPMPDVP